MTGQRAVNIPCCNPPTPSQYSSSFKKLKASLSFILMENRTRRRLRALFWIVGLAILFALYTSGIRNNPPGFYLDESAPAYNAYLIAHTGAGESGPRFPLYIEYYTGGFRQYGDPVETYMLAVLFRFFHPSILLARMFSAFWVFTSCLLLGLLAKRISGRRTIGVIVAATALLTPWFFEGRGLLIEPQFVPMALASFLLTLYHVQKKERWSWLDVVMLAATLALVTYTYTIGRILAPLLALGLLLFATTRQRLISVIKTGLLFGVTLIPILVFNARNPGPLTKRLHEAGYIYTSPSWGAVASQFVKRYMEDQGLTALLLTGDYHPRHHVPGSGGAFFTATFILTIMGLFVVLACLRRDPWWRYILYGLAVSIVPGALGTEPFHQLHLFAYPVFLLVLTIPALEWLLAKDKSELVPVPSGEMARPPWERFRLSIAAGLPPRSVRLSLLSLLLAFTLIEAYRFQIVFRRDGPLRSFFFDVPYKAAYDAATKQSARPIYLEDGKWGPAYIHALWYATIEKRPRSEFVHLEPGVKAPPGKVVISTEEGCQHCETIMAAGVYHVYKAL
jgi:Dolichyl-phosphate-mannose-protein mannosyltransferase